MKKLISKIKKWYSTLPDKKRHLELIAAILSIPMMSTVIFINYNNIKNQKNKTTTENTPIQVIITGTNSDSKITTNPIATSNPKQPECQKDIGSVKIISPNEDEIITSDNVCINISTDDKYCPITWSYQLNNNNWSDYSDKEICLYNLTPGEKQLKIKIKSTVVDKIITLERNFIYQTSDITTTPTSTLTNTPIPTFTPTQ
ncbi:MAG: hypothetical protein WDA13_04415 [Candidatus Shapirobacteria bacterium]